MNQRIKGAFIIFLVLATIIFIFSALFPSEVMTSKWVIVGVEKKQVHAKLNNLSDYASWNDILMNREQLEFHQKDSSVQKGDAISWRNNTGAFDEFLMTGSDTSGISFEIVNAGSLPIRSGISFAQKGDSVQVVWSIVEKLRWYPWEKVYGMMAADMKGPAMQHSLETFKSQLEGQ